MPSPTPRVSVPTPSPEPRAPRPRRGGRPCPPLVLPPERLPQEAPGAWHLPSDPRQRPEEPRRLHELGQLLGRSLFPLSSLLLITGTLLWGPWGTLGLAVLWWRVVTRIA